ncbi:glycine cleavage system aminomethyltransferase GcvT [Pusillimonas sp.]|uniref:glycine cleavage system aminomethyltransferase GcvT n=1 Tax=Pusillimonas sp. TaxID=3040095 RepID=UPI0029BDDD3C|nr:glycine cleavage system aminomethyltransferase GcvT [Pusillimonas sp.]MDX3896263.1 glycine cleavage system aminomethyltransferase GcvT [Pusillimonas sp.]
MTQDLKRTPLYFLHVQAGARFTDFAGWHMPLSYGSQLDEHRAVRAKAGMFDVSHMRVVDVQGSQAKPFLQRLLANDVARLRTVGRAQYSCMLNRQGGVLDDLLVYFFASDEWRLVVNAANAQDDLEWMRSVAADENFDAALTMREELAIIAVQGPQAPQALWQARPAWKAAAGELKRFAATFVDEVVMVARTGYTGEDGYEIILPASLAAALWNDLAQAGVAPCGLAARDTLRLEAGLNLHGQDMDDSVLPSQAGLSWTVSLDDPARRFIGREALEQAGEQAMAFVGLRLLDRGVMRSGAAVQTASGRGVVTSGTMSPTLGVSIAMARVPRGVSVGDDVQVEVRGKWMPAEVVQMPFVRSGTAADSDNPAT